MIYEQRIYHCCPGKLPDLLNRFETITLNIWNRHQIRQAGFWTTLVGPSNQDLLYFLKWESMAEREVKWLSFSTDPEWLEKRAITEANGPIVASIETAFLEPTAFSLII